MVVPRRRHGRPKSSGPRRRAFPAGERASLMAATSAWSRAGALVVPLAEHAASPRTMTAPTTGLGLVQSAAFLRQREGPLEHTIDRRLSAPTKNP